MFCPECGEVMGLGPLDLRRASHCEGKGGVMRAIRRWLGAVRPQRDVSAAARK